jgi:two-component system cell cycle sensor histidine kinase/response regulator CckA
VMNLVLNARDALPGGGRIRLSTRMLDQAHGPEDACEGMPHEWVMLSVSDDGVGMDRATLRRIFEPFFTTRGERGGTGLGLATSYGLVRQSGGDIRVHSSPGQGSRFDVLLPAVVGADPSASAGGAARCGGGAPTAPCRPGRVWLLDDDAMVRELGARLLQEAGHSVLSLAKASDVLGRLAVGEPPPDLLISDVVMPGLSGFEVAVRALELCPTLRVLLMSGYDAEFIDRLGARDAGFPLIEKPFDPDDFVREVGRLVASHR